jgi:hypothetical protein
LFYWFESGHRPSGLSWQQPLLPLWGLGACLAQEQESEKPPRQALEPWQLFAPQDRSKKAPTKEPKIKKYPHNCWKLTLEATTMKSLLVATQDLFPPGPFGLPLGLLL